MSWNNDEGPWGSGKSGGGNPWTKKNPPGGSPSGGMPPPPDLDKIFREFGEAFRRWHKRIGGPQELFTLAFALILAVWIGSGFYQVGTDQVGVVMRFGAFDRMATSGLHYHLPYPIEEVLVPNVTAQNEIQIGFHRVNRLSDDTTDVPEESMMLTQDQNIIDVEFTVFWRVSDIQKFLFEIRDPQQTVKMAAESAMREVIGQNKLEFELTNGRGSIEDDVRMRLQKLMDTYNAGVVIAQINLQTVSVPDEVKAAFQDVQIAHSNQDQMQNDALAHANKVIPEAKGEAIKITQQAMAYHDQKIAIAQGDADRFKQVLAAYDEARDVTAKRLYLETMETILGNTKKIILDKASTGAVPYLPLQDLLRTSAPAKSPTIDGAAK